MGHAWEFALPHQFVLCNITPCLLSHVLHVSGLWNIRTWTPVHQLSVPQGKKTQLVSTKQDSLAALIAWNAEDVSKKAKIVLEMYRWDAHVLQCPYICMHAGTIFWEQLISQGARFPVGNYSNYTNARSSPSWKTIQTVKLYTKFNTYW